VPNGDVPFTYSIDGLTIKVTDLFDTTSGDNGLRLTGGDDAFLDGDEVNLAFGDSVLAVGISFITSDAALAGEIQSMDPRPLCGNTSESRRGRPRTYQDPTQSGRCC
jgi:hypothetical protein